MATQLEVASHLDLSDRQVRNLLGDGILPASKGNGGLNMDACREAYIRYLRGLANGKVKSETPVFPAADDPELERELLRERLRLTAAQAEAVEMKNLVSQRQLAPVDFMTFALARLAARIASILDTAPMVMKRRHPDLTAGHMLTIQREIVRARNVAAEVDEHLPELVEEYFKQIEAKAG